VSIKVLLVDDSPTARLLLGRIIKSAPDLQLAGEATDGLQAVQMVASLRPDVVLMDVNMPHMDGLQATREIMDSGPTPIVLTSVSLDSEETSIAFEAINAGALAVLKKPGGAGSPDYEVSAKELLDSLRAMSGVKVIRHPKSRRAPAPAKLESQPQTPADDPQAEIVSIASSTGGPQTLGEIIKNLPSTFNLPVVIVQHITPDFVSPLVDWLSTVSQLPVRIAQRGEHPLPGVIYFAPSGHHLQLTGDHRFEFSDVPANVPHIPCGDVLLKSVAEHYGPHAVGIVLTGMGMDGARGLRAMYDAGAVTIAQDEASCVIFGMPKEAISLGAARHILAPREISELLVQHSL
jgi:two-component system chemotaxis response regulator CheB